MGGRLEQSRTRRGGVPPRPHMPQQHVRPSAAGLVARPPATDHTTTATAAAARTAAAAPSRSVDRRRLRLREWRVELEHAVGAGVGLAVVTEPLQSR